MCNALNYFRHFLVFVSTVSGCVSISAFALLVSIPINIASSAVGLKIGVTATEITIICQLSRKKERGR